MHPPVSTVLAFASSGIIDTDMMTTVMSFEHLALLFRLDLVVIL